MLLFIARGNRSDILSFGDNEFDNLFDSLLDKNDFKNEGLQLIKNKTKFEIIRVERIYYE